MAKTAAFPLAFLGKDRLKKILPANTRQYIPVLAYWLPVMQYYLFKCSTVFGPTLGPVITESLTYWPILILSAFCAADILEVIKPRLGLSPKFADAIPVFGSVIYFTIAEKLFGAGISSTVGSADLLTRINMELVIASAYAISSPSKLVLFAIPAMLHTVRVNPHYSSSHTTNLLNTTLHSYNWNLLERRESVTGYVSVLENLEQGFRVLRCDHSLLGGEWLVTEERRQQGVIVEEPIYAVFEMLEAVRLVDNVGATKGGQDENALVIGLGIGTAPKALVAHGIDTTVIEVDPVIHEFAMRYFNLPVNHTSVLQDAIAWVDQAVETNKHLASLGGSDAGDSSHYTDAAKRLLQHRGAHEGDQNRQKSRLYDHIIHDVFTGGAEPLPLFTLSFLENLHSLLSPTGVIAINYAGDLSMPSTQIVLNTISSVFPNCRAFRDSPPPPLSDDVGGATASEGLTDFLNIVIFCRARSADEPITFRAPTEADFLQSESRRQYLLPKVELEILFPTRGRIDGDRAGVAGEVLTVQNMRRLEAQQRRSAVRHWEIMRKVVPAEVWENW
ncbi:hypothetical protein LTR66_009844 [Elasticomyces elasticus]|nr:hypothetical protein LTR66_009844 [Elasticomyces elasticus]